MARTFGLRRIGVLPAVLIAAVTVGIVGFFTTAAPAHAAIGQVVGQNKGEVGTTALSNLAFPASVTAGNQIIIVVEAYKTASPTINAPTKVSGTATIGSFVQDATYVKNSGSNYFKINVYRAPVTGGGTLTVGFSGKFSYALASIDEYAGMSASPLDGTAVTNSGTSNTESTGNITTSAPGMVLMASAEMSTKNFTYTQSDTNIYKNSNGTSQFTGESQYKTTAGSGVYNLTAATGNSWFWTAVGVAYKSAGGGGADTTPPSVPANVTGTAISSSQINLSWSASTDNVGVAGYQVFRNGTQVATTTLTSFNDTGLTASTTYIYAVTAFDAAGNISAQSAGVSATTLASADTIPPSVSITSPLAGDTVSSTVSVTAAASDNVGVTGVQFQLDGAALGGKVAVAPYTILWNTNSVSNGSHVLSAIASDAAGNTATSSAVTVTVNNAVSSSTLSYETNFPLAESPISEDGNWIGGLSAGGDLWGNVQTTPGLAFGLDEPTQFGDPTAILTGSWGVNQTAIGVVNVSSTPTGNCCHEAEVRLRMTITTSSITGYEVYCSVMPSDPYCHIARWNGPNGSYCNIESNTPSIALVNGDVLAGTASGTNPVIITGYRNGIQIMQAEDTGQNCSPGGAAGPWTSGNPGIGFYDDQDGNWSAFGFSSFSATSTTAGATTTPDTTPPSVPANVTGTAISSSQINLSWSASTDNVGVAGYQVFRNGTQVATTTLTSFNDTGLTASTTYIYAVTAFDAAGNISSSSTPVAVTTPAVGFASITFVQAKAATVSGATLSVPLPGATGAGDLLVVGVDFANAASVPVLSDTQGNMFTEVGTELVSPGAQKTRLYYAQNIPGGADTIKVVTTGTSPYLQMFVSEYSGASSTSPLDVTAGKTGPSGTVTSGNATTTSANDLVVGFCMSDGSCAAGTGFSTRINFSGVVMEDKVLASPGSTAAIGTSDMGWAMIMGAFRQ